MVGREIKGKVKIHRRGPRSRRENHACGMAGIRFIHEFVLPWELFLSLFLVGFSASPRTSAVKLFSLRLNYRAARTWFVFV